MRFIEATHRYTHEGQDYTPVTYFIKTFQEYVDWNKAAQEKALKLGIPTKELQAQWADSSNKASHKGTAYHKKMETLLGSQEVVYINEKPCTVASTLEREGIKEDDKVTLEDDTLYTEKMIWSYRYKVCGTADIVEVVDGKINIKDYKTNKKLEMKGWYDRKTKKVRKLLGPLSRLDDCKFNIYQVQINVYMYMFLQHNRHLKIGTMELLHVKLNDEGEEVETKVYPIENLQIEVRKMFEQFKTNRDK